MANKGRTPRSSESSRSQRLINSMKIIANGVTHRDNGGVESNTSAISSISTVIGSILALLKRTPQQPLSLNIGPLNEDSNPVPFAPPGPRGPKGDTGATGATGAAGADGADATGGGGSSMPLPLKLDEDFTLAFAPPQMNRGVDSITGTADQVVASSPKGRVSLSLPQSIATTSTPTFGGLTLSKSGAADVAFFLSTPAGQYRYIAGQSAGVNRMVIFLSDNGAESGGNAGSNLVISAYADDGSYIDNVLAIPRAAGSHISLYRPVDVTGALVASGTIKAAGSGNAAQYLSGDGTYSTPPALSTVWTQVINESGSSLANWTQSSGSWSVVSSSFHIDTGATTVRNLRWTAKIAQSALIFQADVGIESTGGFGADNRVGLLFNSTGTPTLGCLVTMRATGALNPTSTGVIYTEQPGGLVGGPTALTKLFNLDQYYTLKVVAIGAVMDVYVDGVYFTTVMRTPWSTGTTVEHAFVGLYAYNCRADFKNIKMYTMTLP